MIRGLSPGPGPTGCRGWHPAGGKFLVARPGLLPGPARGRLGHVTRLVTQTESQPPGPPAGPGPVPGPSVAPGLPAAAAGRGPGPGVTA